MQNSEQDVHLGSSGGLEVTAQPAKGNDALVQAIARHIDGWRTATYGWQGDPDPAIDARNRQASIEAHAAECLRRIHAEFAAASPQG